MRHIILAFIILSSALESTALQATPRNVILIIGDGFDDQHVTMGRNYLSGMSGQLGLDTRAFRASVQIETVSDEGQPLYVADSANTATSL
ncbi:MAG: alkaline phosphatase, partial [Halieaceae bacterium]